MLSTLVHQFKRHNEGQQWVLLLPNIYLRPNIFTSYPGQKGSNLNPPLILSLFFSIILPNPNIGPDLLSNRSQLPSFMFLQHNFSLSDGLLIRKTITTTIESSLCEGWMKCSLYERGKAKVRWLKVRKRRDHLKSWVLCNLK